MLVYYLMTEEVAGKSRQRVFFYLKTHFKLFLLENTNKNLISQYLNQNTLKLIKKTQNLTKEKFYFSTLIYFFRKINDKKKKTHQQNFAHQIKHIDTKNKFFYLQKVDNHSLSLFSPVFWQLSLISQNQGLKHEK